LVSGPASVSHELIPEILSRAGEEVLIHYCDDLAAAWEKDVGECQPAQPDNGYRHLHPVELIRTKRGEQDTVPYPDNLRCLDLSGGTNIVEE